jgi:uncharacterized protein YggT (Ycf19 family)
MAVFKQHQHQVVSRHNGAVHRDTDVVTEDGEPVATTTTFAVMLTRIVYIIIGVIVALLLLRFMLSLLGANRGNPFADFIYTSSQPFAAPFFGLFNYQAQYGIARFEFETLVAAIVYLLFGWLLTAIIEAFSTSTREV